MSTTTAAQEHAPKRGEILDGKYEVEQVLGSGGMGVVVAARHTALRQRVAIKLLLPRALVLPGATERFLREARASVSIKGEHVARVLDVGTLETGAPYMVMEHLDGSDVRALLRARGPFALEEALGLFLQVCEAVAEAHSIGIIHRDLKPANVFVARRPDGRPLVKVLDFGLSKVIPGEGSEVEESLTQTGFAAGSACYASPEQLRDLKAVDGRADIWALGVLLFEMLTKQRPFAGTTMTAVAISIGVDAPPSLTALRPDVPPGVDAIVQRCLRKDVRERPSSVGEIASALAPYAGAAGAASADSILRLAPPNVLPRASAPPNAPSIPPAMAAPRVVGPGAAGALPPGDAGDPSTLARSAWADTGERRKRSRTLVAIAIGALLFGAGASIARVALSSDPAAPAPPITEAASVTAAPLPAPTAVVVEPAPASAAPSSSAKAADSAKTASPSAAAGKSAGGPGKKKGNLLDRWQ